MIVNYVDHLVMSGSWSCAVTVIGSWFMSNSWWSVDGGVITTDERRTDKQQ